MKTGSEQKTDMNKTTKIIRGSVLAAAVLLLILGLFQNGPADIWNKAVRICYECIGIG